MCKTCSVTCHILYVRKRCMIKDYRINHFMYLQKKKISNGKWETKCFISLSPTQSKPDDGADQPCTRPARHTPSLSWRANAKVFSKFFLAMFTAAHITLYWAQLIQTENAANQFYSGYGKPQTNQPFRCCQNIKQEKQWLETSCPYYNVKLS